jgi:hypothetical protein
MRSHYYGYINKPAKSGNDLSMKCGATPCDFVFELLKCILSIVVRFTYGIIE